MRSPASPFLTPRLVVLAAGHFTIDAYSSFFLPLLPLLAARLGLNYAMVGGLTAMASLSSSFSQPLFGLLADRMRRPWFVALGPMIAAVFMASIGLAPSYPALVALLVLGGVVGIRDVPAPVGARARRQRHAGRLARDRLSHVGRARRLRGGLVRGPRGRPARRDRVIRAGGAVLPAVLHVAAARRRGGIGG